jgi:hypothetical protein
MDTNKLGFIIGMLALLLAIPLAVAANLLTPTVRNWYSTTSLKRLNKRIAALDYKIGVAQIQWTFTPAEWECYRANHRTGTSVIVSAIGGFYLLLVVFVVGFGMFHYLTGNNSGFRMLNLPAKLLVGFCILFAGVAVWNLGYLWGSSRVAYDANYHLHTDEGRQDMKWELERLMDMRGKFEYPSSTQ